MMEANKTVHEAKVHSNVTIKVQPIAIEHPRFAAFSDASFASAKVQDSHHGMITISCHKRFGYQSNKRGEPNLVAFEENPEGSSQHSFSRGNNGTCRCCRYVILGPSLLGLDNQDKVAMEASR